MGTDLHESNALRVEGEVLCFGQHLHKVDLCGLLESAQGAGLDTQVVTNRNVMHNLANLSVRGGLPTVSDAR